MVTFFTLRLTHQPMNNNILSAFFFRKDSGPRAFSLITKFLVASTISLFEFISSLEVYFTWKTRRVGLVCQLESARLTHRFRFRGTFGSRGICNGIPLPHPRLTVDKNPRFFNDASAKNYQGSSRAFGECFSIPRIAISTTTFNMYIIILLLTTTGNNEALQGFLY